MTGFILLAPNLTQYTFTVAGEDTYDFVKSSRKGKVLASYQMTASAAAAMRDEAKAKHWLTFDA